MLSPACPEPDRRIATATFNVGGFDLSSESLEELDSFRFLMGSTS